ncbi:hypothetical protein ACMC5U_01615 [Deferribacteres bacterium DY0609]|nr:hypothetical protein [Denitrovibrio acetiphilus]
MIDNRAQDEFVQFLREYVGGSIKKGDIGSMLTPPYYKLPVYGFCP